MIQLKTRKHELIYENYVAKSNENTVLTSIIDRELIRNGFRYDVNQRLNEFQLLVKVVESQNKSGKQVWNRRLALKRLICSEEYILTDTAIRNLFSKLEYGYELYQIIPQQFREEILTRYNTKFNKEHKGLVFIQELSLLKIASFVPEQLLVDLVNYFIQNLPVGNDEVHQIRMQDVAGKKYIRAILDMRYKIINNIEVLKVINTFISANGSNWRVVKLYSDIFGDRFEIRVSKVKTQAEQATSVEPLEYTFHFSNSETGKLRLTGCCGVLVFKCSNGMISVTEGTYFKLKHNRNSGEDFYTEIAKLMSVAEHTWNRMEKQYNESREILIPDAEELIASICVDYSLGKKVSQQILETFEATAGDDKPSLYHLVDAFTLYSHKAFNINQKGFHQLEEIGSKLLEDWKQFLPSVN